ncbi:MAG: PqiC family protein, partial [Candidatus Binataceae bacterium]
SSNERWAEPLDISFKRVLSHDLSTALGGAQIAVFPWLGGAPVPGYRIEMTIDRFDADAQGAAQLHARWTINASAPDRVVFSSTAAIDVPASAVAGTTAAVSALNQAVSQFAGQLAAALVGLNTHRQGDA